MVRTKLLPYKMAKIYPHTKKLHHPIRKCPKFDTSTIQKVPKFDPTIQKLLPPYKTKF